MLVATTILLVHTQPIGAVAAVAADRVLASTDLRQLRIQLIADAGAALVALLVATTLSVYKPWGPTRCGRRAEDIERTPDPSPASTIGTGVWLLGILAALGLFITLHALSGCLHHR